MVHVDYIIIGCGLAGIAFCEQLRKHNKSFLVFDDASQCASKVAGGLYNPVVLKRFTPTWKAQELLNKVLPYYAALENYLGVKLNEPIPVFRAFKSIEEQNNWFAASDNPMLSDFLDPQILQNNNSNIQAHFGLGRVFQTGRIKTSLLIDSYIRKLISEKKLRQESFDYEAVQINANRLRYNDINASYIVFADGFGLKSNPYFNTLPLQGSKGEYIIIKAPDLKLAATLKGSIFIIPLKEDTYLVGATYDNEDKTNTPTDLKKQELINKLKAIITCRFEIIDQIAGLRPTVKDRRPLVGQHRDYRNLYVLNGLGTRGVMISPYIAEQLYSFIEKGSALDHDIDIKRFPN